MCHRNFLKTEDSWASGHCQKWHRELKPWQRKNLSWKWNACQINIRNETWKYSSNRTIWAAEEVLPKAKEWLLSRERDLSWVKWVAKGAEEWMGQWKVWNGEAD